MSNQQSASPTPAQVDASVLASLSHSLSASAIIVDLIINDETRAEADRVIRTAKHEITVLANKTERSE